MQNQTMPQTKAQATRLYYLDWLRVIAISIVFLFHAVHPFDFWGWHVKNAEQSEILTIILTLFSLWGMSFFFLVAGSASWFALQRRTPSRYLRERFNRLVIPYIVGTILFWIPQIYFEWGNRVYLGTTTLPFQDYLMGVYKYFANLGFRPIWLAFGNHLWFLSFLFAFALITLPLFLWLKREPGSRLVAWLASVSDHRGGILMASASAHRSSGFVSIPFSPSNTIGRISFPRWVSLPWVSSSLPTNDSRAPSGAMGGSCWDWGQ